MYLSSLHPGAAAAAVVAEVADAVVAMAVKAEEEGRWQEDVRKPEFVVFAS